MLLCTVVWICGVSPCVFAADLTQIVSRIKPSIVAVGTFQPARSPAFRFLGTGFAVGNGHIIATNAHVVPQPTADDRKDTLVIAIPGAQSGAIRPVSPIAVDANSDLAILRLEGEPLPPLSLGNGALVSDGQTIAFTGFPIGSALGLTPVTHRGIVSAVTPLGIPQGRARDLNATLIRRLAEGVFKVYQLDATSYPGNSGSPMFDAETGEVLGIVNMAFVKKTKESALSDPSGISYAIPVVHLKALLKGAE
ncbi:MAG TPA: serine protease [Aromatoleum sp.]|uniref:S1 family peptidase n=1 Tax=Aromatoleum sp. TaxID=2307007 RepID=UPI002B491C49|nr:serine protease [Aromatoleum sp.]HJV26852.1 serine protease [Aromatoleum sp.]